MRGSQLVHLRVNAMVRNQTFLLWMGSAVQFIIFFLAFIKFLRSCVEIHCYLNYQEGRAAAVVSKVNWCLMFYLLLSSLISRNLAGYCFVDFGDISVSQNVMAKLNGLPVPGSNPVSSTLELASFCVELSGCFTFSWILLDDSSPCC